MRIDDVSVVEPPILLMPKETQRQTKSYDHNCTFQDVWDVKLPWTQVVIALDGKIHQIICMMSTMIEDKEKLLAPKMDGLWKHARRQKARVDIVGVYKRGEYYVNKKCMHVKMRFCSWLLGKTLCWIT